MLITGGHWNQKKVKNDGGTMRIKTTTKIDIRGEGRAEQSANELN